MTRQFLSGVLLTMMLAVSSFGSAITNVRIRGQFHNPTDDLGPGVQPGDPAPSPSVLGALTAINWGITLPGTQQSGYQFAAINQPALPNIAGPIAVNPPPVTSYFTLGTFTHNNFVVDSPVLTSVMLDIVLNFDVDGIATGPLTFTYLLQHTETDNNTETGAPICPFLTPVGEGCTDRVLISGGAPQAFSINGVTFTLDLAFQIGGSPINQFITREQLANNAELVGRFAATSAEVPESSTAGLVGVALLGLGLARRRLPKRKPAV